MKSVSGCRHLLRLLLLVLNLPPADGKSISIFLQGNESFVIGDPPNTEALTTHNRGLLADLLWLFGPDGSDTEPASGPVTRAPGKDNETLTQADTNRSSAKESDKSSGNGGKDIVAALYSRKKRFDMSNVNKDWATTYDVNAGKMDALLISDKEIRMAELAKVKEVLVYAGSVIGSTVLFVTFAFLLFRYPEFFICGCCFSFCCIKCCCPRVHVYMMDPQKYLHDRMNKFVPGMIVEEDGTIEYYQPTQQELDLLSQIMAELMS